MKFKKKYIKLGKPYIEGHCIKVHIKKQSHRCGEFGNQTLERYAGKPMFKASNGINLCSRGCPQAGKYVFMRGDCRGMDNEPIIFDTLEDYLKFEAAVKEYNEHFNKPRQRRSPWKNSISCWDMK